MAYDEGLAERIRTVFDDKPGVTEKKMFGGIAFLFHGHMFVGIAKNKFMVRVGPERHAELLKQPHVRPMDFTGKPMVGYVFVSPAGIAEDKRLEKWIQVAMAFVSTLPEKKAKKGKARVRTRRAEKRAHRPGKKNTARTLVVSFLLGFRSRFDCPLRNDRRLIPSLKRVANQPRYKRLAETKYSNSQLRRQRVRVEFAEMFQTSSVLVGQRVGRHRLHHSVSPQRLLPARDESVIFLARPADGLDPIIFGFGYPEQSRAESSTGPAGAFDQRFSVLPLREQSTVLDQPRDPKSLATNFGMGQVAFKPVADVHAFRHRCISGNI